MSNGDCPIGARHDEALKELTRRMESMERCTERIVKCVEEHVTEERVAKATLSRIDKLSVAVLTFFGPLAVAVLTWWLTMHSTMMVQAAEAVATR